MLALKVYLILNGVVTFGTVIHDWNKGKIVIGDIVCYLLSLLVGLLLVVPLIICRMHDHIKSGKMWEARIVHRWPYRWIYGLESWLKSSRIGKIVIIEGPSKS